jgi:hypothetical protein
MCAVHLLKEKKKKNLKEGKDRQLLGFCGYWGL